MVEESIDCLLASWSLDERKRMRKKVKKRDSDSVDFASLSVRNIFSEGAFTFISDLVNDEA